jgi:hypothetical protein
MKGIGFAVIAWLAAWPGALPAADVSKLTPEAEQALAHPGPVTLYSLEPTVRPASPDLALYRFDVLGKAELDATQAGQAIASFRAAMKHHRGPIIVAMCFEPRHAISILSKGHRFDFLLCYACGDLEVFRDGKMISDVPAFGSPDALNALLVANGLPLSTSARARSNDREPHTLRHPALIPRALGE